MGCPTCGHLKMSIFGQPVTSEIGCSLIGICAMSVPRIDYFVERVIQRYNFRVHFRISRDTFYGIVDLVKSYIMPELERLIDV